MKKFPILIMSGFLYFASLSFGQDKYVNILEQLKKNVELFSNCELCQTEVKYEKTIVDGLSVYKGSLEDKNVRFIMTLSENEDNLVEIILKIQKDGILAIDETLIDDGDSKPDIYKNRILGISENFENLPPFVQKKIVNNFDSYLQILGYALLIDSNKTI